MSLERLEALRTKIIETERLLKVDELKNKMELLAEEMNRPDFWSHQENAQTISQDYQDIKTEVEKWSEIERQVNELVELCRGVVPTPSSSTSDDHAMLT